MFFNTTKIKKINEVYNNNSKITQVLSNKCWKDKRVFIIGGGESLQNFNFDILKKEITVGLNKAFTRCSFLTINYSMDVNFYLNIHSGKYDKHAGFNLLEKWNSFKGIKIFLTPVSFRKFGKDVYLVRRKDTKNIEEDIDKGIYGGSNSGTGALMLAATLGAKEIYLLGYDMKVINKTHWHEGYPNRDINLFRSKLDSYAKEISSIAPILKLKGIEVFNLNKESALKAFRFKSLEEVLKETS